MLVEISGATPCGQRCGPQDAAIVGKIFSRWGGSFGKEERERGCDIARRVCFHAVAIDVPIHFAGIPHPPRSAVLRGAIFIRPLVLDAVEGVGWGGDGGGVVVFPLVDFKPPCTSTHLSIYFFFRSCSNSCV